MAIFATSQSGEGSSRLSAYEGDGTLQQTPMKPSCYVRNGWTN